MGPKDSTRKAGRSESSPGQKIYHYLLLLLFFLFFMLIKILCYYYYYCYYYYSDYNFTGFAKNDQMPDLPETELKSRTSLLANKLPPSLHGVVP